MGIVYRAYDIPNGREVAVKIINIDTANALTHQQFLREIEIAVRLKHPHIVAVHETGFVEIGAQEPSPFIVMELVRGSNLNEIHRFTYARIIDIGKQICDALEYVHDQGYVYRDLKPGNVILEKRGFQYFVKLMDFGLARPRGEAYLPAESSLAGTVFYLAPELIAGQPADIGSDLYALGVTLYEMVTGRVPFSNLDEQNVLSQHLEEQAAPPSHSRSDVPPALDGIIIRLLAKDPKDRFSSARDVYSALEQIVLTPGCGSIGNLPQTSADFIGHENEIARIVQLLEENQLVTLLSQDNFPSLVIEVGKQLSGQFVDGVWLVRLESVDGPMMVLQTVASILGVRENINRPLAVTLMETLREKNLLLLLTHCELFPSACVQLAETILSSCPDVRILATSHHPLSISAEKCYQM